MANPRAILVSGDAVCDHHFYRGDRLTADSNAPLGFRPTRTGGGALLLLDILAEATRDLGDWSVRFGLDLDLETLPLAFHGYTLWEPQPEDPNEKDQKRRRLVWRAVDPPLGFGHPDSGENSPDATRDGRKRREARQEADVPARLLVIDDAGLDFRRGDYRTQWPFAEDRGADGLRWVVLTTTKSDVDSDFWREVVRRFGDRLILILSADDLRRRHVGISRGLSWEATVEDVLAELQGNPLLIPLRAARHVIVTFASDGACWIDNTDASAAPMFVFDASRAEGEWEESQGKGNAFGFLSSFTAAVVRELCRADESGKAPDFEAALSGGLAAMRLLRRIGHGPVQVTERQPDGSEAIVNPTPGFPFAALGERIRAAASDFVSAPVPQRTASRSDWMMLDEWQLHARDGRSPRPHFEAALAVAVLGASALERFPVARFWDLQTVDRKEIESLRTIRQLIHAYEHGGVQKKPLSLGVFGPPGAGKSFGVTQIAKAVLGVDDSAILTFNLSQFNTPADLNGAFHRVRDKVLSGSTPLVFWDEFDSQDYRWLQYLLAPMQDGAFQDGQLTHPIGKCIFVFAGATSPTFDAFGPRKPEDVSDQELGESADRSTHRRDIDQRWTEFVLKKGPDFKSRLAAYLNVLGPNPRQRHVAAFGRRQWTDDPSDSCYPIRRALFIRAQFKLKEQGRLQLDLSVVKALLEIPHYKSGARSLEFLCQHLRTHGGYAATRSSLPGRELLDMHVDADAFWDLCERDREFEGASAALAEGLHANWLSGLTEEERARNPKARPWEQLDPDTLSANLAQAARIPRVVALAGLRVVKGPPLSEARAAAVDDLLMQDRELLAEAEHNHWMVERMLADWRYAKARDDSKKRHHLLIPYAQLPGKEQDKDRHVKDYQERVQRIGFRLEPID